MQNYSILVICLLQIVTCSTVKKHVDKIPVDNLFIMDVTKDYKPIIEKYQATRVNPTESSTKEELNLFEHPGISNTLVKMLMNIPNNVILADPVQQLPDYVNLGIIPVD